MAVLFSPKQQFQSDTTRREAWQMMANDRLLHSAISHSYAEMVARGLTEGQLVGVNSFVHVLLNLSEDKVIERSLPDKPLTSYDPKPVNTITK